MTTLSPQEREEMRAEVRRYKSLAADHFRNAKRLAARVVQLEQGHLISNGKIAT